MKPADIRNLTFASLVLLITGLVVPCMTIRPQLGDLTGWVKILAPEALVSESYSILGGIGAMFEGGSPGLGTILFLFSVIFPTWKLLTFLWFLRPGSSEKGRSLTLAVKLGKYSMLDVFVIAVLVVGVKGLPGGSTIEINAGLYFFAASVLLSMLCGQFIKAPPKTTPQAPS